MHSEIQSGIGHSNWIILMYAGLKQVSKEKSLPKHYADNSLTSYIKRKKLQR